MPGDAGSPPMRSQVVEQLLRLNREFYDRFDDQFAETRGPEQPGLRRLLAYLPSQGTLLDAGCGNGRLALMLDLAGRRIDYWGVDASAGLLDTARRQTAGLRHVRASFVQGDLAEPGWSAALPAIAFDAVTALAVLHHMPGWRLRLELLSTLRRCLAPGGMLALSTWQFFNSPRLLRKLVPWEEVGLTSDDVEPGDYLLDWRRGGRGLRYCHLVDEVELSALARSAQLAVEAMFYADGREGRLNLFALLRAVA